METDSRSIPTKIGNYPVERELGRGGMGMVYQARDVNLDRSVAIKVLPPAIARDPRQVSWFRREARMLASINHPNIATIFGLEEREDGAVFLVLELIEGRTLAARLRESPLNLAETLAVGEQIAEALEAAHERGLLHRDLKPGNVMLTAKNAVKVLDFGLAKPIRSRPGSQEERETTPTDLGMALGTPGYMSPEHVRGREQDERTDIFAFGCVLYECLAGRPAFHGETVGDILVQVVTGDVEYGLLPPSTPAALVKLLQRCLEKDPESRLGRIAEALDEIRRLRTAPPEDLAPAAPPRAVPNNLPARLTSFVGRRREFEACRALLAGGRHLTLTGVGGAGKTRLALYLAEELKENYPDGVWFADLGPIVEGARVAEVVVKAVGAKDKPEGAVVSAAAHIGAGHVLLVLDNCEHLLSAAAALTGALLTACPNLRLLATSRERLGVEEERTFLVSSLGLPETVDFADAAQLANCESVRLFVERAAFVAPGFTLTPENASAVGEICRTLDGIPLAIELAAARVQVLSAREIQVRLEDRFRLLIRAGRSLEPRHQTLAAAIDWSYEQLRPDQQTLFRTVSVFSGGWTLAAARVVLGPGSDEFETLDLLSQLVDKSLVVVDRDSQGETRYRMLETMRRYGADKLAASGAETGARNRHLEYYTHLASRAEAERHGADQAGWRDRIETEHDNMLAAFSWARSHDEGSMAALRLAGHLGWFWLGRGYITLGRSLLTEALEADPAELPNKERAKALVRCGALAQVQGDYPAAQILFQEGLRIYRALEDQRGIARSVNDLARLAAIQGRYRAAEDLFNETLKLRRRLGDDAAAWRTMTKLGLIHVEQANYDAARRFIEESLAGCRSRGDLIGIASALNHLGEITAAEGDAAAGHALSEESLKIKRQMGDKISWVGPLLNLAYASLQLGDHGTAGMRLTECLELVWDLGERRAGTRALEGAGMLAETRGETSTAALFYGGAAALREVIGSPMSPAERTRHRGVLERLQERLGVDNYSQERARGFGMTFEDLVEAALTWLASQQTVPPVAS